MTTVTVDSETGEIMDIDGGLPVERSLAVIKPSAHVQSGLGAIAALDDTAFDANLALIKKGVERAKRMQEALLTEGEDYGSSGNVKRPFLHKPGAEKFEKAYGLVTRFKHERMVGDGATAPALQFLTHAYVHLGDFDGPIVAEGAGEANSWETKYRYRGAAARECPNCAKANVIKSRPPRTGWWCGTRDGGCGASFEADDPKITGQPDPGKAENTDPWDLANTLVKMSTKRAYVDGILRATATSGLFTQDEDSPSAAGVSSPATVPSSPAVAPSAAGERSFTGRAVRWADPKLDGELRYSETGASFGFVLESLEDGKKKQRRALFADAIAEMASEQIRLPSVGPKGTPPQGVEGVTVKGRYVIEEESNQNTDKTYKVGVIYATDFLLPPDAAAQMADTEAELDALLA